LTTTLTVDYGHVEPLPIHFDDLDAMGLVHNGRYPVLLERAITPYWSQRGHAYTGDQASSPDVFQAVREFTISYLAPIRGTGVIGVHFWIERIGQTSATYGFRFLSADGETVHAEGERKIVRLDPATFRPAPWSPEVRDIAASISRRP
jgi:acyl-CoA thioester hydrolase